MVRSVLTFGIACWGGNVDKHDMNRLNKVIKKSENVIGRNLDKIPNLCATATSRKMTEILKDDTHPLYKDYQSAYNPRSGRYRMLKAKSNRHVNSFLPRSVSQFNNKHKRNLNF